MVNQDNMPLPKLQEEFDIIAVGKYALVKENALHLWYYFFLAIQREKSAFQLIYRFRPA